MKRVGVWVLSLFVPLVGLFLVLLAVLASHPLSVASLSESVSRWWNTIVRGGDPFTLIEKGDSAGLDRLLKLHPEMSRERFSGYTYLHLVYDVECARILLKNGADIDGASEAEHQGSTPLQDQINRRHTDIVLFLIDKGASVTKLDLLGRSPLHFAAELGDVDLTDALLKKGADPSVCDRENNFTPPLMAAFKGKLEVIRYYHEKGISFDVTGALFLTLAANYGSAENAMNRFLLDTGKVDVNSLNKMGEPFLYVAAYHSNSEFFRLLLEHGADPEKRDSKGKRVIDRIKEIMYLLHDTPAERDQILKLLNENRVDDRPSPAASKGTD